MRTVLQVNPRPAAKSPGTMIKQAAGLLAVVGFVAYSAGVVAAAEPAAPVQPARPAQVQADAAAWTPLFNGKDLTGWTQRGGKATYAVEDGAIVGRTAPNTSNTFLVTDRKYGDFILELEFKVDPKMNSGIQFRSTVYDEPTTVEYKGKTFKFPANRVHGYQYEIDPSARKWTAGIYDEGRRGWLADLKEKPEAGNAFKQGEWNRARIEARGDTLRTWINDVPAAELKDDMTLSGVIALQVHAVGARVEPMEVRWRNIRIQELGPAK